MSAKQIIGWRGLILGMLMSGCAATSQIGEQIRYTPPRATVQADQPILLRETDVSRATSGIYNRLGAAGHRDRTTRRTAGVITGRSPVNDLVDCGILTQTALGETSSFAANAPQAVIFGSDPLDLSLRQVTVATEYRVTVTAGTPKGKAAADLAQTHMVTIRRARLDDGEVLFEETRHFAAGERARFGDGTVCVSSGRLRADLR